MSYDFALLRPNYEQVIAVVSDDLKTIKTGRAKPSMVEEVMVEAYGTRMSLKEVASITAPDPHMIVIAPWDRSVTDAIAKALRTPPQTFNPAVDGQQIRINIPPLTGETRELMIKQVAQKIESGKQMLRNERMEGKKKIEAQKGQAGISEDDITSDVEVLEKLTKEFIEKLEQLGKTKEEELRQI